MRRARAQVRASKLSLAALAPRPLLGQRVATYLRDHLWYQHVFLVSESEAAVAIVAPDIDEPDVKRKTDTTQLSQMKKDNARGIDAPFTIHGNGMLVSATNVGDFDVVLQTFDLHYNGISRGQWSALFGMRRTGFRVDVELRLIPSGDVFTRPPVAKLTMFTASNGVH